MFNIDRDFSQYGEQKIILDFFLHRANFNTYCVDAGAFDGVVGSNSRALLLNGWQGVVIEPNPRTFSRLQMLYADRPDIVCIQKALSNARRHNVEMKFAIGPPGTAEEVKWQYAQVSTLHQAFAASYEKDLEYIYETLTVNTDTLTAVLREVGAPRSIGFLSIDCEGEDINIARELDLQSFRPQLICIEAIGDNRKVCADIFEPHGYSLYACTDANVFFCLPNEAGTSPGATPVHVLATDKKVNESFAELQADLIRAKADIVHLEHTIHGVLTSRSWRITKPLRALTDYFRKVLPPSR